MTNTVFKCKQCGRCCKHDSAISFCATAEDIMMWKDKKKHDILEWIKIFEFNGEIASCDCWFDPDTDEELDKCPWLSYDNKAQNFSCTIHDFKPSMCRNFPLNEKHAKSLKCKGYE